WFDKQFMHKIKVGEAKNLQRAAIYLSGQIKKKLGDSYPPASEPDTYPHLRHGELRRSIAWELDKDTLQARVGTNKIYGRYLELGTTKMDKRPFLAPTLHEERRTIARIATGNIKL